MKVFKSFFNLAKKAATNRGKSAKIFDAYDAKDYDQVLEIASSLQGNSFIRDIRREDTSLLHQCAIDDNFECMAKLVELPFFQEIVNDQTNSEGWTAFLHAATNNNKSDGQLLALLAENGADITLPKESDGYTALHIAASMNDV